MLVLRRKVNERIIVGNVTIVVTKLQGNAAWIGIEAPKEIEITRPETVKKEDECTT